MAKERSKDKGGALNGQSKSANNNRSTNDKIKDSDATTNRQMKNTGHTEK